eukprot:TRINITY_DN3626_c1_g1_i1.p1 TRINITY_DN3626_c1_g1~~TRINITY_DN3626_c1_g1_i1.p1  ORF type:complete len:362 (-),score=49.56 TRINITY_DN3626_c1_g1_i1:162-1247(-)
MSRVCGFCPSGEGAFTCPRCHKDYCGLKCYQSSRHSGCSEEFYKDCVKAELVGDNLSQESKQRMQQILARMSSETNSDGSDSEVDSDDDENLEDLADRLQGVDLDDAHSIWEKLSASERREFTEMLEKGDVNGLLPQYTPWWHFTVKEPKIQELDAKANTDFMKTCPEVWKEIPKFSIKTPSETIKFGVMNLLYGYAYTVRYLHGDYKNSSPEFVNTVELLVGKEGTLGGRVFELADTAVETAASRVNFNPEIAISQEFSRSVKQDVYKIIKGPCYTHQNYYVLAALSDLRTQYLNSISQIKQTTKDKNKQPPLSNPSPKISLFCEKSPDLDPKILKLHVRKIEFYLSWCVAYHETEFHLL